MNRTFLVTIGDEITTERELDEIYAGKLFSLIYRATGFRECEIKVKEINVEQTCGTPENVSEKALDLLKRASDSLEEYHLEIMGRFGDSLATEIEDYIRENTKG